MIPFSHLFGKTLKDNLSGATLFRIPIEIQFYEMSKKILKIFFNPFLL